MDEDKFDRFETTWLTFGRLKLPNRKTKVWQVTSIKGIFLGDIKWFRNWRCYAFFPVGETVFNTGCLRDIKEFIDKLMDERK